MDFGKIDQPSMHDLSLYSNFQVRERESWLKHLKAKPASARKISANQRGGYMVLPPDTQVSGTFVHSFIA